MTKKEPQADKSQKSVLPNAIGKGHLERLAAMQSELFATLQEVNRHWLDRMQSEAARVSEFAAKLTAAPRFPRPQWSVRNGRAGGSR
jgi:hypothetical protein